MSSAKSAETSRSPIWLWPVVTAVVAGAAGWLLAGVRPTGAWTTWLWPGDVDSASTLLQVVAGAVVTVATLTFSLTVVALQLASQQFSPRLLRDVTRDPVSKRVLAVLAATFAFSCTAIRGLDAERAVPVPAVFLSYVLGVVSFGAGLLFITHMTRVLRVDTMMLRVHAETRRAIEEFYPPYGAADVRSPDELTLDTSAGRLVPAGRSGFVRAIDVDALVRACAGADAVVRVEGRPGDHLVQGTPLATVWAPADPAPVVDAVHRAVELGYERTLDQDAAFGLRQLEDIAVKAVSPAINDPVTAATAIGHQADLVVRLLGRRLGPTLHADPAGCGRVVVPDRDLRYHLDLCCGQVARFGRGEPTVLAALLRLLRDAAVSCRDDHQRAEVTRAARYVGSLAPDGPGGEQVADVLRRVEQALAGDVAGAYADRAGETRSI